MENPELHESEWEEPSGPLPRPWVTYILCWATGLMFLVQMALRTDSGLALPGMVPGWEITQGALWGLLTPFFLNLNLIAVGFNIYALYWLGSALEPYIGWLRFALFWLLATAIGSFADIVLTGTPAFGGAPVCFALLGLFWVGGRTEPYLASIANSFVLLQIGIWLAICVALSLAGVANFSFGSSVAGFLFGATCGYVYVNRQDAWAPWLRAMVLAASLGLVLSLLHAPWLSAWNLGQSLKSLDRGESQEALDYLNRVDLPHFQKLTLRLRLAILDEMKRPDLMIPVYRELLDSPGLDSDDLAEVDNNLAWIMATAADPKLRNPKEAIRYAQLACDKTNNRMAQYLDTLAAAYAANGQFDKAVEWQEKALKANTDPQELPELLTHMSLFKANKPYIEGAAAPPKAGDKPKADAPPPTPSPQ